MATKPTNTKLTQSIFFAFPAGAYLVSEAMKSTGISVFEGIISPLPGRQKQWERIVAAKADQKLFRIFKSKSDYSKWVVDSSPHNIQGNTIPIEDTSIKDNIAQLQRITGDLMIIFTLFVKLLKHQSYFDKTLFSQDIHKILERVPNDKVIIHNMLNSFIDEPEKSKPKTNFPKEPSIPKQTKNAKQFIEPKSPEESIPVKKRTKK